MTRESDYPVKTHDFPSIEMCILLSSPGDRAGVGEVSGCQRQLQDVWGNLGRETIMSGVKTIWTFGYFRMFDRVEPN